MLEKLKHPRARRVFILLCTLGAVLSAGANIALTRFVGPLHQARCVSSSTGAAETDAGVADCSVWLQVAAEIAPGITIEFLSAFLIAIFFFLILLLIREDEEAIGDVQVLYQADQRAAHLDALKKSPYWHHNGHLASWVRRYVLPEFQDRCRRTAATCQIKAAILDPTNRDVCETYLSHVRSLEPDEQRITTLGQLHIELCSSIYQFAKNRSDHLEVEIYLKNDTSLVRDDLTSVRAFWTTVGRGKPAIVTANRPTSTFYHIAVRNFSLALRRYRKLDLDSAGKAYHGATDTAEHDRVGALLLALFPGNPELHGQQFCESVVDNCLKK